MQVSEIKDILRKCGIAGAGGAGFPSYAKLSEKADTIILNCAECEPLFKVHRQLLERYAKEIVSTLNLLTDAIGAKQFIIAVKGSYEGAINAATAALKDYEKGKIKLLREVYPAGDEIITIYESTGRVVPPGSIPIEAGCIVYNVETVLNMYNAINFGMPVTHKYVTVAGEVKNPMTLKVPIGTTYSYLVSLCGGTTRNDVQYLSGGPMMGRLANPFDIVTKTTNGILVMPKDHYIVMKRKQKNQISVKRAMGTCCQCRSCTDLCSRHLLGYPINPSAFMRCVSSKVTDTKAVLDTNYCSQCGLCELYSCPQGLSPRTLIGIAKSELKKNGLKVEKLTEWDDVNPERDFRVVPMKRLIERLDLTKYNISAPLSDDEVKPKEISILMSQHIGKPAEPHVKVGQKVKSGELIAAYDDNALSIPMHSSVNGTVKTVTGTAVTIAAD